MRALTPARRSAPSKLDPYKPDPYKPDPYKLVIRQ